jgi:type I restriction enzyme S subunit
MKMKLKDMASLVNGYAFKSEKYVDNGIRVIRIANVQDGYLSDESPCYYPNECRDVIKNANLCENDLLMSLTGNVGRVAFVTRDFLPAGLNQRVECIRPNESDDKEYLYYYFRSQVFREKVNSATTGCAQQNLSIKWLENHEIPYYDKDECRNIVEDLKHFDCVISNKKEQLKSLDELVKSRFIEMFGNLGEDIFGRGITTLGECTFINPKKSQKIDDDVMISFVPMPEVTENGDINGSIIRPYKEVKKGYTYFENGDVLFAKITPCMENGKGCVVKGMSNNIGIGSTEFHVIRPKPGTTTAYWIYTLTMLSGFRILARSNMTGAGGQRRVPVSFLENFPVAVPPISLQNQFAEFVKQVDKSKFIVQKQIKELQELLDSKMDEYFG